MNRYFFSALATLLFPSSFMSAQTPNGPVPLPPQAAATVPSQEQATRAVLWLRTELSSKGMAVGKPVKAELKEAVVLPSGQKLPRGTIFAGTVVDVNRHSKDKQNGVVQVAFDRISGKGVDPATVTVKIIKLEPSGENTDAHLPNRGGMVFSNNISGGQAQMSNLATNPTAFSKEYKGQSTIAGVYLAGMPQSSGAIFALKDDLDVDPGIQLTVLIFPAPAETH